jgi:DICT domain-containing protein
MEDKLGIGDVAERTGIATGTIRMWEQRYGFPVPDRAPSGYRLYTEEDVRVLTRASALRHSGMSVAASLEHARAASAPTDRPSIFAALASGDQARTHVLEKRTLIAMSRAIEEEALARASAPVVVGAFQHRAFYRAVESRWRALAQSADASVVFADFDAVREPALAPAEIPIAAGDALGNEWAVICDAPGYAACLLAWEQPGEAVRGGRRDGSRRFECMWTMDPGLTRRAVYAAARIARSHDDGIGDRLETLLADRPLAFESPAPGLTALTNRMLAYVETRS